eukprot:11178980-Lingulodinium_polyedra.AAC.1
MPTRALTVARADMCLAVAVLRSETVPRGQQRASELSGHALDCQTFCSTKIDTPTPSLLPCRAWDAASLPAPRSSCAQQLF